jgi:hypothetical protein
VAIAAVGDRVCRWGEFLSGADLFSGMGLEEMIKRMRLLWTLVHLEHILARVKGVS